MKKIRLLALVLSAVVLFNSCKKSVEGESSKYQSNLESARGLKSLYPGFSAPLDAQISQAESAMEASKSISEESQKISKMAEANKLLTSDWIGELKDLAGDKSSLRSKLTELHALKTDKNDRKSVEFAQDEVNTALSEVDRLLQSGARDASGARSVLRTVTDRMGASSKSIDKLITSLKSKVEEKAEDKKEAKETEEKEKLAAQPWKCEYCGKSNLADAAECGGCGAAKPNLNVAD